METEYTRKEMEERLPDFIFGKLGEDETLVFTRSLPQFPDLEQEIAETRAVFARMERIDVRKIANERTRDLAPKVNNRLGLRAAQKRSKGAMLRFAIPMLAVILLAYIYIFQYDSAENSDLASFSAQDSEEIMNAVSTADDIDSVMLECALPELTSSDLADLADDESLDKEIEYTFIEDIAESPDQSLNLLAGYVSSADLTDEMDGWTEDDFQDFLQEIQNEKINS